jgi:NodT family efflux transporter outer membrane factor (OMF) lipoprotein
MPPQPGQTKIFNFFSSEKKACLPLCVSLAILTGCNLAPKYQEPVVTVPVSYQEAAPWQRAAPADAAPKGAWWTRYNDAYLNTLEARLAVENPSLQAEAAVYDQARAVAAEAEAGLLPDIGLAGHISANRQSNHRPLRGRDEPNEYMDNAIDTQAKYEIDIWRKVANAVKAGKASAAATAADLESLRLSLHAELATAYFTLRGLDAQAALLASTAETYRRALELTQNRFAGHIASGIDVARAAAQYHDAQAQYSDIAARRAESVHAIAILIGVPPPMLSIAPSPVPPVVPAVDAGLPSTLLQRRPDVASAERLVAAANAEIGVTKAAFYPNISLNLVLGFQDTGFNLYSLSNSFWSVGPGVTLPLFQGGLRTAELDAAKAAYRQAVAAYKSTVLNAFGDVEDQLALLHWLGDEQAQENEAVKAARQTLTMAMALYKDGATDFLDVVTAQTAELAAERAALNIHTRRVVATVALIRALGGGWDRTALPT